MGRRKRIRKERFYPYPPDQVWVALTDPRAIAEWLEPNDFKAKVGHKFRFECDPGPCGGDPKECEVLEVEAPRRLAYSWAEVPRDPAKPPGARTVVTWTLLAEGKGTRLVLEHEGVEGLRWWTRFLMRFGWGYMVNRLIPRVLTHTGPGGAFTPGAIPLAKRAYTARTVPQDLVR